VTVALVVAVDDETVHGVEQEDWTDPGMLNEFEAPGVIPGLVAVRVYPSPCWLIDRSENEAMPPLALTVKVPDSDPAPGFDPMATVMAVAEPVASWPDPSRTSTLTGPPWEPTAEVITALTAVSAGSPSLVNASEHDPATEPARFPALAGSSWKSLPVPLKSFDCLALMPHW
jgi:hypothetical protein